MLSLKVEGNLASVIKIAVDYEESGWYIQTTDIGMDTFCSETIDDCLEKVEAIAIAEYYARKLGLQVEKWDHGLSLTDFKMAQQLTDIGVISRKVIDEIAKLIEKYMADPVSFNKK